MALARLISRGQTGLTAYEVMVEVHLAGGLPTFTIAGLPAAAVRESRDRVRAALHTCGLPVPAKRITAHLGPADIPKEGGRFDLPIALGIVQAEQQSKWPAERFEFIGELALSGELKPVCGVLPAVLAARDAGRALVLPAANAEEAALVSNAEVYRSEHLLEVLEHLNGGRALQRVAPGAACTAHRTRSRDLADVRGQHTAKRAMAIAAAGGHNLLMIGPPGSGKSMLAERLPGLLPSLSPEERLCVASIASVAGQPLTAPSRGERPFRAPHHTASAPALVGGGPRPRPGEVTLAHLGVLFLDELPEFSRAALEALREPLEAGVVRISRVQNTAVFPAQFQLLAAMNPCPCGYLGDGSERCRCSESRLMQYRSRVSGPLLDRFDLQVEVPRVSFAELVQHHAAGESAAVRRGVTAARARQLERGGTVNARLSNAALWSVTRLSPHALELLRNASQRWQLSVRSATRVVKVARTIADLDESPEVSLSHLAEALQLRCLDRPL